MIGVTSPLRSKHLPGGGPSQGTIWTPIKHMGTMHEWLKVLFMGIFWGGSMALMNVSRNPVLNNRKGRILFALEWIFAGLLFGILTTFSFSQVLHPPLVFITVVTVAGMFISAFKSRNRLA